MGRSNGPGSYLLPGGSGFIVSVGLRRILAYQYEFNLNRFGHINTSRTTRIRYSRKALDDGTEKQFSLAYGMRMSPIRFLLEPARSSRYSGRLGLRNRRIRLRNLEAGADDVLSRHSRREWKMRLVFNHCFSSALTSSHFSQIRRTVFAFNPIQEWLHDSRQVSRTRTTAVEEEQCRFA